MKIRKVFISITGIFLLVFFSSGLTHYQVANVIRGNFNTRLGVFGESLYNFSNLLTISLQYIGGSNLKIIENHVMADGVHFFVKDSVLENLNLLTSYKGKENFIIDLISFKSGTSIKKWYPDLNLITDKTAEGENRLESLWFSINKLQHPIILKDSSIISNTGSSLVKINADSEIEWIGSDYEAHHSVELDHENNIWISGRKLYSKLPELNNKEITEFYDDLIMKINPDNGEVMFEKSVIQILKDNDLYDLVFKNGNYEIDPIHLNDVQPALTDSDYWEKGDLLISPRHLSTIILYRPSSNKILWHKQGPWLNQHDPDFLDDNRISIFGNQVFRGGMNSQLNLPNEFNSVFIYDFETDSVTEPYKTFLESEKIKTITEGRSEILSNGDLFVEETNKGRIFIGDTIKKKLSFSRRLNDDEISYLHWSRIIKN